MIIRILEGLAAPDQATAVHSRARQVVREATPARGCIRAYVGRQVLPDLSERIVMITVWTGVEDLYRWLGVPNLLDTALHGEPPDVLSQFHVQHYETLEIGPDGWIATIDPAPSEAN